MLIRCGLCAGWYNWNTEWGFHKDTYGLILEIQNKMYEWIGILAFLGLGKRFLNFNNKFTQYFSFASFSLYFFHQSIIVTVGYFLVNRFSITVVEYFVIMISSFIINILCYEICRRIGVTRFLFGIKKINKEKQL